MAPFALHTLFNEMNMIKIEISEESFALEERRPPEKMDYDDFLWCVGVTFSFMTNTLVIEASLFGFMRKVIEGIKSALAAGRSVLLNDENGGYQINLSLEGNQVFLHDAFGNGSASLPIDKMLSELNLSFSKATAELESRIPLLLQNGDYTKLKSELEKSMQNLT